MILQRAWVSSCRRTEVFRRNIFLGLIKCFCSIQRVFNVTILKYFSIASFSVWSIHFLERSYVFVWHVRCTDIFVGTAQLPIIFAGTGAKGGTYYR
jgi:hypothetical protein